MKINSNNKEKKSALERERFSGFVIDLRETVQNKNEKAPLNNQQNYPKNNLFSKISSYFKNLKIKNSVSSSLNLLKPVEERLITKFKTTFNFNKEEKKSFWSKLTSLFNVNKKKKKSYLSKLASSLKASLSNYRKNNWRERVRARQRILSQRFRLNRSDKLALAQKKVAWYRSLLTFTLVLLFLILPLKLLSHLELLNIASLEDRVMNKSKAAVNSLLVAFDSASSLNFEEADIAFSQAGENFLSAKDELSVINDFFLILASLSNDPKFRLAAESKNFLAAGAISSSLGRNLILATNNLFEYKERDILLSLEEFLKYGHLAVKDAKELKAIIEKINPNNLPLEYREQFVTLSNKAEFLTNNLESFVNSVSSAKEILGLSRDKRYLLIFQNNNELRASGGFLGSFALLDVSGGKIKNLEVPGGGSYDTEGGMSVRVKAPEPLWLVNPAWHFWDANWWPDWPTTAHNLMWFYEKSGGPTVDGVVSFTPTVVESLLKITGPIDLSEEYGVIIDSQNFWEVVQKIVEHENLLISHPDEVLELKAETVAIETTIPLQQDLENNPDNKPKKIIGDLMAKILEILPQKLDKENLLKMITLFEDKVTQKHILFYFTDPLVQAEFSKRNFTGEVKDTEKDYLMVVNTNIAGQKSDRKMLEEIQHVSKVNADGKIINTVKILRTHTGIKNEPMTGVRNVNWLRVYVPLGSRLIFASDQIKPDDVYFEEPEADWLELDNLRLERLAITDKKSGFKIYEDNNKTVFAGWVMIDPGETQEIVLVYELPFNFYADKPVNNFLTRFNQLVNPELKEIFDYSLLVQKQPGAKPSQFSSRLEINKNLEISYRHPENLSWDKGWFIDSELKTDKYFSILFKK